MNIPSRNNCSDNCSSKAPQEELVAFAVRDRTLSSFPSHCPIATIISLDKLISATDAFAGAMESIPPMQTSRSLSILLGCKGISKSFSWIIWQRFSNSTKPTSVGLTYRWNNILAEQNDQTSKSITGNTSSSRWLPNRVFRCWGLPIHLSLPPTLTITFQRDRGGSSS